MGLRLTRAGDYAVRAMIHIACLPEGQVAMRSDVARSEGIPGSFMAKILRSLVRAGLLRSTRGTHGGFALARTPSEINLLDIVEAIEGPITLTDCAPDMTGCDHAADCPASAVWNAVQEQICELLRAATLESLVSAPRKNRRAVYHIDLANGHSKEPALAD